MRLYAVLTLTSVLAALATSTQTSPNHRYAFGEGTKVVNIVAKVDSSSNFGLFHVNRRICLTREAIIGRDLQVKPRGFYSGDPGSTCFTVARALFDKVPAIQGLLFTPYSVYLTVDEEKTKRSKIIGPDNKGRTARLWLPGVAWEKVEPPTVEALRQVGLSIDPEPRISQFLNPAARKVSVNIQTLSPTHYRFTLPVDLKLPAGDKTWIAPLSDEDRLGINALGSMGSAIAQRVLALEGVTIASMNSSSLDVRIGDAFTGYVMNPQVQAILQEEIAKAGVDPLLSWA